MNWLRSVRCLASMSESCFKKRPYFGGALLQRRPSTIGRNSLADILGSLPIVDTHMPLRYIPTRGIQVYCAVITNHTAHEFLSRPETFGRDH